MTLDISKQPVSIVTCTSILDPTIKRQGLFHVSRPISPHSDRSELEQAIDSTIEEVLKTSGSKVGEESILFTLHKALTNPQLGRRLNVPIPIQRSDDQSDSILYDQFLMTSQKLERLSIPLFVAKVLLSRTLTRKQNNPHRDKALTEVKHLPPSNCWNDSLCIYCFGACAHPIVTLLKQHQLPITDSIVYQRIMFPIYQFLPLPLDPVTQDSLDKGLHTLAGGNFSLWRGIVSIIHSFYDVLRVGQEYSWYQSDMTRFRLYFIKILSPLRLGALEKSNNNVTFPTQAMVHAAIEAASSVHHLPSLPTLPVLSTIPAPLYHNPLSSTPPIVHPFPSAIVASQPPPQRVSTSPTSPSQIAITPTSLPPTPSPYSPSLPLTTPITKLFIASSPVEKKQVTPTLPSPPHPIPSSVVEVVPSVQSVLVSATQVQSVPLPATQVQSVPLPTTQGQSVEVLAPQVQSVEVPATQVQSVVAQVQSVVVPAPQVQSVPVATTSILLSSETAKSSVTLLDAVQSVQSVPVSATQGQSVPVSATQGQSVEVPATQVQSVVVPATKVQSVPVATTSILLSSETAKSSVTPMDDSSEVKTRNDVATVSKQGDILKTGSSGEVSERSSKRLVNQDEQEETKKPNWPRKLPPPPAHLPNYMNQTKQTSVVVEGGKRSKKSKRKRDQALAECLQVQELITNGNKLCRSSLEQWQKNLVETKEERNRLMAEIETKKLKKTELQKVSITIEEEIDSLRKQLEAAKARQLKNTQEVHDQDIKCSSLQAAIDRLTTGIENTTQIQSTIFSGTVLTFWVDMEAFIAPWLVSKPKL